MKRIVVVGGGVAGLTLAHNLLRLGARERGVDVIVLERAARAGGNLRSDHVDGYLCEAGPNGFLDNAPRTLQLVSELGLDGRLLPSHDRARRRYIYRHGRLHRLPGDPLGFLRSGLLSWPGKLRIAWEPFAKPRPAGDESIHDFAARRIGQEAAWVLVGSMVSGVFAGDARALSLRACFPKMWEMETEHGGLFRALFARVRAGRRRRGEAIGSPLGRLTSFRGGVEELVHGLTRAVGPSLRVSTSPAALQPRDGGYELKLPNGDALHASVVVLACPPGESARLLESVDAQAAAELRAIASAPIAVVALGFASRAIPPLDGFGFLVPRGAGPRVLGVLWDSSIFSERAPEGRSLLRAMLGGALDPDAIRLADDELIAVARRDLASTMNLRAEPELVRITRHPLGIPQYTRGHLDCLARIDARLARLPGLFLTGNGYRGVAINACVAEACEKAASILSAAERAAPPPATAASTATPEPRPTFA
jgi:oxygen-dependent protoporphyrinogen oxidase